MTQPISKEEPLSTIFRQGNLLSCDVTNFIHGKYLLMNGTKNDKRKSNLRQRFIHEWK